MLNYNSPPVTQLRNKILEIEAKPKPKHVNIVTQHYHVSGKKDRCLIVLKDTVYDILSVRYYTRDEYPNLRLYVAGVLISTVTEEVEMLPIPYIPVQPLCKALIDIFTDRNTSGELVVLYGERINPEEGTCVVTNDRTRIFMNEDGFVNTLPLKKHEMSYHLIWYDTTVYAVKIKEFIENVFVITKKKTHVIRAAELNNIIKKEYPLLIGNISQILQDLGIIYKRRADGMYYCGLIYKKDLNKLDITEHIVIDKTTIKNIIDTVHNLRDAIMYIYNKLSTDSETQKHMSLLKLAHIQCDVEADTDSDTDADMETHIVTVSTAGPNPGEGSVTETS